MFVTRVGGIYERVVCIYIVELFVPSLTRGLYCAVPKHGNVQKSCVLT